MMNISILSVLNVVLKLREIKNYERKREKNNEGLGRKTKIKKRDR